MKETLKLCISDRIKEIRTEANLTQSAMGETLSVSQDTVSLWEKGLSSPNAEQIYLICSLFKVSADYLLGLDRYQGIQAAERFYYCDSPARLKGFIKPSSLCSFEKRRSASRVYYMEHFVPSQGFRNFLFYSKAMIKFAERVRELRLEAGMTRADLAQKMNVSVRLISYWESGKRECDFSALCRLADLFSVTVDYLLGRQSY